MIFTLSHDDLLAAGKGHHEVLVVLVADGYDGSFASTSELAACMAQAAEQGHLRTEAGKRLDVYRPEDAASGRVVILGVGSGRAADIQEPLQKLARELAPEVRSLAVCFAQDAHPEQLQAAMLAVARGGYLYGDTKPSAKAGIEKVALGAPNAHSLESAWAEGQALVAGVELARGWGNRPANHATPSQLADAAQDIVRQGNAAGGKRFACQILDQAQVEKLGMGAFLAVAKGSEEPLRFIVLEYRGANKADAPLVFVGKGITFDSGGISLKPGAGMDEMKFDMCGAASVLGLFEALRHARPSINVVGLIPSCENMPSGRAIKPGDVVTSLSGQTIEILNTDAEGRLILCDALTYAERFQPRAVVDIATLTGNCVLALGHLRSGLFTTDDALAGALEEASRTSADLLWRLPMDDVYGKGLRSNFADMANVAGREAGAISAAKFLEKFTSAYPWAHLDIAGTAWDQGAEKGATGRPVPLLLKFVLAQAASPVAFAAPADAPAATVAPSARTAKSAKSVKGADATGAKPKSASRAKASRSSSK